ncbi:MAG: GNAT family N-acetyltransferase [Solirubrobacterales bacterium]|nr:GNAT family N-acetyltransferase [Solirubrobacterales bacterium]
MELVHTHDGTSVLIRQIRPDDAGRLRATHAGLSAETQYRRFLGAKPELSVADARYLTEINGSDHFALVATPLEQPERIVAVGRFVRDGRGSDSAECAIVVADAFQRRGLGTLLLERLAVAASERGIRRFRWLTLADNAPALRLVGRVFGERRRQRRLGRELELELELPAPGVAQAHPAMIAACGG